MKGELYRRWLLEGRDLTLEEFVAERRAEVRQARSQRRFWAVMGPQMQQAAHPWTNAYQMQNMAQRHRLYGSPLGGALGTLWGGLFR